MSLILDALNRSRNDAQQVPGLATSHHDDAGPAAGRLRTWLLAGALAVAVMLIIWLLWERGGNEVKTPHAAAPAQPQNTVPAASPGVDAAASAPAAVPAPAPTTAPATAPAPASATAPAPASATAAAPEPTPAPTASTETHAPAPDASTGLPETAPVTPADAVAVTAAAAESGQASASASVAALYRQQQLASEEVPASSAVREAPAPAVSRAIEPEAPMSVAREEQPIDIEELVEMAEQELENARLAEHPAPFLSELSQQTKDTIPTLLYQAHDYADGTADSFVLINGKTLKQGASTKGVRVDEILPDSVVLSFQGTQFRLRALNSWVNL